MDVLGKWREVQNQVGEELHSQNFAPHIPD